MSDSVTVEDILISIDPEAHKVSKTETAAAGLTLKVRGGLEEQLQAKSMIYPEVCLCLLLLSPPPNPTRTL